MAVELITLPVVNRSEVKSRATSELEEGGSPTTPPRCGLGGAASGRGGGLTQDSVTALRLAASRREEGVDAAVKKQPFGAIVHRRNPRLAEE